MTRFEVWLSHFSTIIVGVSGVIYLWMKYFMQTDDPFAVVNHPLQPTTMTVHVLAAPILTFLLGMTVSSHVRKKIASGSRSNRLSGLVTLVTIPAMVVSGYLLQTSTNELFTRVALVVHLVSSGIFALTYLVHQVVSLRLRRAVATSPKDRSFARRQTA